MTFTNSSSFPFWVGGVTTAIALAAGASGALSNLSAGCVLMPGILLVLDASVGTQALNYYFFATHPFTQQRVRELYFARSTSFPRYGVAVVLSAIFAAIVVALHSEMAIAVGLVACIVAYGLLAGVGLIRCILQASREVQLPLTA
jgi:hypothetical protein